MVKKLLNPSAIDALARGQGKKLDDPQTAGLSIERLNAGKCRWLYRRRIPSCGTIVKMHGGLFPATTIADARAWAATRNGQVEAGVDPRLALREPDKYGPMKSGARTNST